MLLYFSLCTQKKCLKSIWSFFLLKLCSCSCIIHLNGCTIDYSALHVEQVSVVKSQSGFPLASNGE